VDEGSAADVSEVHTASIFRVEVVGWVNFYVYIALYFFKNPLERGGEEDELTSTVNHHECLKSIIQTYVRSS
jgi:hypothetical protein